jgi:dUTP pyrophosphatase
LNTVEIDKKETLERCGIDTDKLPADSHAQIVVFCTRCGEHFLRERRRAHQPHACPSRLLRLNKWQKWCISCHAYVNASTFTKENGKCDKCVDSNNGACLTSSVEHPKPSCDESIPRLEARLIHPDAKLPFRKRTTDVGHDLYASEDTVIPKGHTGEVKTGLQLSASEGWYYTIEGRSGLFRAGITPFHGIIDATYCGEVIVVLLNANHEDYVVSKGDRVAQIILHRSYDFDVTIVKEFGPDYDVRGEAGWGSSGQ